MKNLVIVSMLILLAGVVAPVVAQVPEAGVDYEVIQNGRPLAPADGKVVVEEFFNYICPACNLFEPEFAAWISQLPDYVRVDYVPASFRPDFVPYANAYYAAQALGVAEQTHKAIYDAIHHHNQLPKEGDRPDEEKIAAFYAGYGVDGQKFLATMRSFGVKARVRAAAEHMKRSRIASTPSLLINGRYLIKGRTYADRLRIAGYLIEKEYRG